MKILGNLKAPEIQQIRMFSIEKEISIKFEQASNDDTSLDMYPVLVLDDGTNIYEPISICRYLEEVRQDPCLMGSNAVEKANIDMWNKRIQEDLFDFILKSYLKRMPAWKILYQPKAQEAFCIINQALTKTLFIAGDKLSIADMTAFVALYNLIDAKIRPSEDLSAIRNWYNDMSKRECAALFDEIEVFCAA